MYSYPETIRGFLSVLSAAWLFEKITGSLIGLPHDSPAYTVDVLSVPIHSVV